MRLLVKFYPQMAFYVEKLSKVLNLLPALKILNPFDHCSNLMSGNPGLSNIV